MNKILIAITALLLIISFYFMSESSKWKFNYIQEKSVPDIDLKDSLNATLSEVTGNLTGFVVFTDNEKQPRDIKQYYEIDAISFQNETFIYLKNRIATKYSPPVLIEKLDLKIKKNTTETLELEDENGVVYSYNKISKKMNMYDGDSSYLITNNTEYKDFIKESFISK